MEDTIEGVVGSGLCLGCGTCVAVCPTRAAAMRETPGGLLEACIDRGACTGCGVCAKVCPGSHLEAGLLPDDVDPSRGTALAVFAAKATNRAVLRNGQSGGVVTALLLQLIRDGRIDAALVSEMPDDGSLRPVVRLTAEPEELARAQGSKYCPIPVNEKIADWRQEEPQRRVAFVGVSCHVHGLKNLQRVLPRASAEPYVTIGLFCDRVLAFTAMDYLIAGAGLRRGDARSFRYKSKELGGWPGNIAIQTDDGSIHAVSGDRRMECKNYFTPLRCRFCFDKLNVLADLSLGDAWGVQEDKEGTSVIIARTRRGLDVLAALQASGSIELREVDLEQVVRGQDATSRFRDWQAYLTAWRRSGRPVPRFPFSDRWSPDVPPGKLRPYEENLAHSWHLKSARSAGDVIRRARWAVLRRRLWARWRPQRVARAVKKRILGFWPGQRAGSSRG